MKDKNLDKVCCEIIDMFFSLSEMTELGGDDDLRQHIRQFGLRLSVHRSRSVHRNDLQDRSRMRWQKKDFAESTLSNLESQFVLFFIII